MEFFAEFLLEIYMQLMFLIVPKAKKGNKKYKVIATLIAIAVFAWRSGACAMGRYTHFEI